MTRYDDQMPDVIDAEAWAAIWAASEADAAMSTWIGQQIALCDAATDGPWAITYGDREPARVWAADTDAEPLAVLGGYVGPCDDGMDDAAFIAAARTSLPKALAALRAVGTLVTKHDPTLPAGTIAKLDLAAILATLDEDGAE